MTETASVPHVGFISPGFARPRTNPAAAFREGLGQQTYVEGQNLHVEWRYNRCGQGSQLADLAAELVALPVQVVVAISTPAPIAVAQATCPVPIVAGYSRDLIELGLAQSDARPGGCVTSTGSTSQPFAKLVDLPKQSVPTIRKLRYPRNRSTAGTEQEMARSRDAAHKLGLEFIEPQATSGDAIEPALQAPGSAHADGLIVSGDTVFYNPRATALPQRYRPPTIYSQVDGYVDYGRLMGYSTDGLVAVRRTAVYVDKILRGASPAELPSFQFGNYLRTAEELEMNIPDDVLLQDTQVIR